MQITRLWLCQFFSIFISGKHPFLTCFIFSKNHSEMGSKSKPMSNFHFLIFYFQTFILMNHVVLSHEHIGNVSSMRDWLVLLIHNLREEDLHVKQQPQGKFRSQALKLTNFVIGKPLGPFLRVKVKVTQPCPTLCDPMDCSPPGSSVLGMLQVRVLEWVAIPFSRGYSQPRDRTQVSLNCRWILYQLSHQGSPIDLSLAFVYSSQSEPADD